MKQKPSFRLATDELIDIGQQLIKIESQLRIVRCANDTDDARLAAEKAASAASRMSRKFKEIAWLLERIVDAEYEEEKSNGTT
jgi:hypothetical protein